MSLWGDDRGAAIQVGAAILFAFVIIAITTYQVEVVPNQNAEIEFDHNQDVQDQLQEVRNDAVGVSNGNGGGSQSVTLGTTYPARTIFVNPGPAAGSLRSVEPGDGEVRIENANATTSDGTENYWNGSRTWTTSTQAIEYRPNYNVYSQAPVTVYEHSALYNRHQNDEDLGVADQILIEDDEITLVALRGDLQESTSGTVSVRTRALSKTRTAVPIEPEPGQNITITVPTDRPAFWNDTFADAGYLTTTTADNVTVELDDSYDLSMASVGVGTVDRGSPDDRAEYVVEVDDGGPTVVAEVRDQFNNPVPSANVSFRRDGGSERTTTTDSDGEARIAADGADTVDVWINDGSFGGGADYEGITIDVESGGGGGGVGAYAVDWNTTKTAAQNANVDCNSGCTITGTSGDTADLWMGTDPAADGADVSYSVSDTSVATVDGSGTTDGTGQNETTFEIGSGASDGDTVTAFTSSGSDGDRLSMTINLSNPGPQFQSLNATVDIQTSQDRIREAEFQYQLDQSATVTFSIVGFGSNSDTGTSGTVLVSPPGQQNLPTTLRADVNGESECYEITVPSGTSNGETFDLLNNGSAC